MKHYLLLGAMMLGSLCAVAQEDDDECGKVSHKKVQKLIDQSFDTKKYEYRQRYQFLKEALTLQEDCAPCIYELGKRSFTKAQQDGTAFNYAEEYFTRLISTCPKFHTDPYYYLGVIHYGREDYAGAIRYFKEFLAFRADDDSQMARDYTKKVSDVQAMLPELEFYDAFFKKPLAFNPVVVENVSTTADEYLPALSPDNELLFFTRKIDRTGKGDLTSRIVEEFTMSTSPAYDAPFDAGTPLPRPFNVGDNYGGFTISVDNREIIICACKKDNPKFPDYNNCDLYSSKYERWLNEQTGKYEYKWSELQNLGPGINRPDSWEAQPSLSADGKTLFFAVVTEKQGEEPNSDIYYSTRDKSGNWTPARPVEGLNTPGNEKAPFIHSDSKTLYFAAQINETYWGAGGFDIFYTRQLENGKWSKPENLGYPINSVEDEHGLIVSTDGKWAYYASARLKGSKGLDIYRFELPEKARPEKVVIVKGQLLDEKGDPLKDARVEISYAGDSKKEEVSVNQDDGSYAAVVNVEKGQDAVITVKKKEHTFDSRLVSASSPQPLMKNADLRAEPIKVGNAYTINDILFATNAYELPDNAKFVIDQFIEFLRENPSVTIAIHGHTDNVGNAASNLTLSENRAQAVREYIVSKGISASRVSHKGFGQSKPKVPNTTEYNRSLNRRTEFVVTGK